MIIALGSDHAGYEGETPYKPAMQHYIESLGHTVLDCGTNGPESVDYPDFAAVLAKAIIENRAGLGVLLCGTGIGIGMAANKHRGIRAATCATLEMARLSREHNDANVLCLGQRILTLDQCTEFIKVWLDTPFDGGARHCRRINKIG
ncbi:MAG: ribose 5-phosphate isomerase B [Candidatus Hydrogenedentes bacterium]|nr:ribose 5-phosphate isomerase B [Candidatus Hydrogenedentota bacterium]